MTIILKIDKALNYKFPLSNFILSKLIILNFNKMNYYNI